MPILQNTSFRTVSHINDAILLRICTNIVEIEGRNVFLEEAPQGERVLKMRHSLSINRSLAGLSKI